MSKVLYDKIADKFVSEHGAVSGQMFGKPCIKKQKAFAVFFRDEMVFKLGAQEVELLKEKYPGSQNFDPSGKGRPMKDWIQVPGEFSDEWESLTHSALEFTLR